MKREPNLFEAFQAVSPKPDAGKEPAQPSGVWQGERGGGALASPTRLAVLFAVAMLLSFAAGYFVRGGMGEPDQVRAAGPSDGASEQPLGGALEQPWYATDSSLTTPKSGSTDLNPTVSSPSGLYNAENLFTVLAITYKDVPSNQDQAKKISDYLQGQGLPAFEPISRKGRIEILVGAAKTSEALDAIASRLRRTPGPSGRSNDFQSAYTVKIDDHLDRGN